MLEKSDKSISRNSNRPELFGEAFFILEMASEAFDLERPAMQIMALWSYRILQSSNPTPLYPPVTMKTYEFVVRQERMKRESHKTYSACLVRTVLLSNWGSGNKPQLSEDTAVHRCRVGRRIDVNDAGQSFE